jgi:quinoprotein glucose dehydrogenase
MGLTFVLHRETGEPIWPVEERPVPQDPIAGEYFSPTQPFPTHIPHLIEPLTADDAWGMTFLDEQACRDRLGAIRNDGFYTPPSLGGSILYPSMGGGNNWGSPAIHLEDQIMVVLTWRIVATTTLKPREECADADQSQDGTPYCVDNDMVRSPIGIP